MNVEHLLRLVRVARGLEAEGMYNAAKLCWALAYSEEIRASNDSPLPRSNTHLDIELETLVNTLKSSGQADAASALETARQAAKDSRTIAHSEIPQVHVCRFCGEVMLGNTPERCPNCGAHRLTYRDFRPIYYFEPLTPEQVLAALESGPELASEAIRGLSETQMTQVPAPGEWSVRELIWHLLVAQELLAMRAEKILTQDDPSLAASAAWNIQPQADASTGSIFEQYRASRQNTLDRLKNIDLKDWWRTGWHEEFAQVTLLDQATYFARHEHGHLSQFAFIRKSIGA
jgi:uncharacterized damage-inducible protein DinB